MKLPAVDQTLTKTEKDGRRVTYEVKGHYGRVKQVADAAKVALDIGRNHVGLTQPISEQRVDARAAIMSIQLDPSDEDAALSRLMERLSKDLR